MTTLTQIKSTIAEPLKQLDLRYRATLQSPVALVNEINDYLLARSGKQIRPLLVLLSAYAGHESLSQEMLDQKIELAITMEMLHNSSLMHDDVVDESELRRGRESVRHRWSNKIAVLCGDYYLALVMEILNRLNDISISQAINNTVIEMTEGELLQQQVSRTTNLDEENYNSVIYKKTASLMATCCEIGYAPLRDFGKHFGMAFQIRDDIMDYHPDAETGKPQGNDIRERKMTLPILKYLQMADCQERERVLELLKHEAINDEEADALVNKVADSGALTAAAQALNSEIAQARQALTQLKDSDYKTALYDLAGILAL